MPHFIQVGEKRIIDVDAVTSAEYRDPCADYHEPRVLLHLAGSTVTLFGEEADALWAYLHVECAGSIAQPITKDTASVEACDQQYTDSRQFDHAVETITPRPLTAQQVQAMFDAKDRAQGREAQS